MSKPLSPSFVILAFATDLLITLSYGFSLLGKTMRAVNIVMLIAISMAAGAMLVKMIIMLKRQRHKVRRER